MQNDPVFYQMTVTQSTVQGLLHSDVIMEVKVI